jgi:hypothetical protein
VIFSTRRSGGLLACLLTLHLSLIAGDPSCGHGAPAPRGEARSASADAATHHAHHLSDASAADRTDGPTFESCRTPTPARCCDVIASCQIEIAFAARAGLLPTWSDGAMALGSGLAPASGASSPDIPPPKA